MGIVRDHLVPLALAGRVPCPSSFASNSFCSSGVFLTLIIGPLACEQKARGEGKTKEQHIQVVSKYGQVFRRLDHFEFYQRNLTLEKSAIMCAIKHSIRIAVRTYFVLGLGGRV